MALTPEQLWQKLQDAEEREQQTAKELHQKAKELQEANEREQEAKKREQEASKREQEANEREHQKAKELQEANERVQEAEQKIQKTDEEARGLSWLEALSLWDTIFANPEIKIRYRAVQASHFTTAKGRRHPQKLRHWGTFHRSHKSAFTILSNEFAKPEARAFASRQFYVTDAERFMSYCLLDDEVALVAYEQKTVEELVISTWQQKGSDRIGFKSRQDHSLDDVTSRLGQMNTGSGTARPTTPTKRLYDKVCHIAIGKAPRRDLFVIEYKAADKLTPDLVLEGLHDMDIDAILQQVKVSTDKDKRRKEIAEEVIAVVVTQTFDYMVDQGLSYGYITGGDAFIFLFIRPDDPQTLYYEKVILGNASATPPSIDSNEKRRLTAVGLVAGFAQMAMRRQPLDEAWRSNARKNLSVWEVDEDKILAKLTPTPFRNQTEDSPGFQKPDDHTSPDTSPAHTRSKTKAARCQKGEKVLFRLPKDDDPSGRDARNPGIANPGFTQSLSHLGQNATTTDSKGNKGLSSTKGKKKAAHSLQMIQDYQADIARPDRPYCTQACLLGLIRGHALDNNCPNVQAHPKRAQYYSRNMTRGKKKSRRQRRNLHALDQQALVRLIDNQLQKFERDDDGGFKSLARSGWAGALFRLELLSHGYTFVAKGTVKPLVPVLQFEANMYKRMETIQGKAIPVHLGNIDLRPPFHLTTRAAIVHLMLLSWAGEEAWRCGIDPKRLRLETTRTDQEVVALGVQQGDMRPQNVLWNYELDRAILIDFEYARIEEADDKIGSAIEVKTETQKKTKVLGEISGNRAPHAGPKNIDLGSTKICDGTSITLSVV